MFLDLINEANNGEKSARVLSEDDRVLACRATGSRFCIEADKSITVAGRVETGLE